MTDNEKYLTELAEAEKRTKKTELEQAKAEALKEIQLNQDNTMPTFTKQKQQADNQSQIGAKNFAEYLANRNQSHAGGLSAEYEMRRQNALGNQKSEINTAETDALKGFNTQREGIETNYTNTLNNTLSGIDNTLNSNLYNERLRQQQLEEARKQQEFENQLALKNYNLNASNSSSSKLPEGMTYVQNGIPMHVVNGKAVPIQYATKKDPITGKETYIDQKSYDWNKKGYFYQPNSSKIKFGDKNYGVWANSNNGNSYIIAYDIPLPITGNEKNGKEVITNAYNSGAISKEQLKTLTTKFGY